MSDNLEFDIFCRELLFTPVAHFLLLKGPAHSKNENFYFLAPAQTNRMQPILVSYQASFRSNLVQWESEPPMDQFFILQIGPKRYFAWHYDWLHSLSLGGR